MSSDRSSFFGLSPAIPLALLYAVGLLPACSAGTSSCEVVESRTLADDEASPEGMSALDVLELTQPHLLALSWLRTPDGQNPTNADPDATVSVDVAIERAPGAVRHVVTEQTGSTEENAHCGANLYIPVRLTITTSDGALQDSFTGDLVHGAERPGAPWIIARFEFADLSGTLRPTAAGASGEVHVEFAAEPRGWIAVRDEVRGQDAVTESWVMAGSWGDVPPLEN
ncbi:hypothetical protein [Nannocystis punicea]|uniref:Lipoprotein n=1 Tax=Nannocystis punicea TaxID=2995304 RepID=A0ABY7H7Z6_9BACT|nr:hypothetical protein [Nannocystis poenicansa]WAS95124.1 hypothetical protein O0S08_03095 [Nannocystis poenicansa]